MNDDNDYAANHPVTGESYDPRLQPRFTEIPTFMRAPLARDLTGVDIGLIGVPTDLGVTNRAGARHGPREIRNASSFMRAFNLELGINPFELCTVRDLGDVHFRNWFNLDDQVEDIAAFFTTVQAAGVRPLSAGGDHSITYPILKGINTGESLGLVHIDAHTDTWAEIWGSKFHHGAPFRLAVEDGPIDPKRTIQHSSSRLEILKLHLHRLWRIVILWPLRSLFPEIRYFCRVNPQVGDGIKWRICGRLITKKRKHVFMASGNCSCIGFG